MKKMISTIALCAIVISFLGAQKSALPALERTYVQFWTGVNTPNLKNLFKQYPALEAQQDLLYVVEDVRGFHHLVVAVTPVQAQAWVEWAKSVGVADALRNDDLARQAPPRPLGVLEIPVSKPAIDGPLTSTAPATYGASPLAQAAWKLQQNREFLASLTPGERTALWKADSLKALSDPNRSTLRQLNLEQPTAEVPGREEGVKIPIMPADGKAGSMAGWNATIDRTAAAIEGITVAPYRVRFARFANLEHAPKAPPVEGLVEVFVEYAITGTGQRGGSYYLVGYQTRDEAIAAAAAYSAQAATTGKGFWAVFDPYFTDVPLVVTGVVKMPPTR